MSIERLDIIIQKTLPLVYDDSLSYLEFLAKVVAKVNEAIDELNIYLNQDLRSYVEQRLIAWQADGTLDQIFSDTLTTGLDAVNAKIGTQIYTEENYITTGEDITSSLNTLDITVNTNYTNLNNSVSNLSSQIDDIANIKSTGGDDTALLQAALNENIRVELAPLNTFKIYQPLNISGRTIVGNGATIVAYGCDAFVVNPQWGGYLSDMRILSRAGNGDWYPKANTGIKLKKEMLTT